ncbi:hypothetical protein PROSTU_00586 [Providencia stuartii ATCC 25827]|uniref:Uncharacterized protein n=1 Tax=Providencia stuartii ATCC 25827 TaxID=471874 RepID=A0AA87CSY5_PROST|nr:hypothetical protein PROSTU_00586 [Providencia stuartii ATCC 25827]
MVKGIQRFASPTAMIKYHFLILFKSLTSKNDQYPIMHQRYHD